MATSFIVNLADLTKILEQIKVAELHASTPGMSLLQAIQQYFGVSAANAALLPVGLRTVDGRDNNLLPGNSEYGAADTLFPRMTTPRYLNDTDGDSIDFDGAGPGPTLTGGNYGGPASVVDADPRIISNLIVDQTPANPAAVQSALAFVGITGSAAVAAANAIVAAYKATLHANGADAAVDAAQAALTSAVTAHAAAASAHGANQARADAFTAADRPAEAAVALADSATTALDALATAIDALVAPEAALSAAENALAPAEADSAAASTALTAAIEARDAYLALPPENQVPEELQALETAVTTAQGAFAAAEAVAQPLRDDVADALATVQPLRAAAADAFTAASDAAVALLAAADAAANALDPAGAADFTTPEALAAAATAQALVDALGAIVAGGVQADDLAAAEAAVSAFAAAIGDFAASAVLIETERADAVSDAAASQLMLDGATTALNAAQTTYDNAVALANTTGTPEEAAAFLSETIAEYGIEEGTEGGLFIPNVSPDVGLSQSFNSWMTFFGQFFDHGLDLVTKGGSGTVYVPLTADDPLVAGADKVFGTADDLPAHLRFMALTRATPTIDETGQRQHENQTTAFVDQNQTYTSHASHQVFLREYARLDLDGNGARTLSTGHLLDHSETEGGLADWGDVKAQALTMLGIALGDLDVLDGPLLATDPYGNLILGANGYAQLVMAPDAEHAEPWLKEGSPDGSVTTAGALRTGHAFLDDIAHHAAPGRWDSNGDGRVTGADAFKVADADPGTGDDGIAGTYDDEMLDAHFATGDGRGNENIALSAVHSVFHSEHNRLVEANKLTILESGDRAFINEWLLVDLGPGDVIPGDPSELVWDGARLFQAARFVNEMQYQHLVFEEFARRLQPAIDPFVFTNTADIDPGIVAEFAHVVYRFGHSMLTDTVERLNNDLETVDGGEQLTLIEAFLNPTLYTATGADAAEINANLVRGLTRDRGNEIDEFVVPALQSNLLGLPLDLATLNIARGREAGIGSLNEIRAELYNDFALADLKPYVSWADFAQNMRNPASLVNFLAAYGTHPTITGATTMVAKRTAALELVFGVDQNGDNSVPADRVAFLTATGAWAGGNLGGLNLVDFWIGSLAEERPEFGGMLGSTFNFIFEHQMESLEDGDRFYYLSRTQGMNLLNQLEPNTFTDLVMRNTDLSDPYATHLPGSLFSTPDLILELDRAIAQAEPDPTWDDPLLDAIAPKVVRVVSGVVDANDHDVGGELRFSGGEHVVIGGTEGNDILTADLGDDTLWGDGGDDYINGGGGADNVFGGDGDDVIEDNFGDDFLRGEAGNDVISAARGVDLVFGGEGNDAIFLGQDMSEVFGGEGNDFILGSSGPDGLFGNEGDDWIEGGEGFDVISADNSELFFNSAVIGHDVMWGQGNDQDYDMESGDDIAVSGAGVERFEGMFGFDWVIAKFDPAGADFDFNIPIFTTELDDILRDRFDKVEGASGWRHNDVIVGADAGQTLGGILAIELPAGETRVDHALTQEGIDRIEGLRGFLDDALTTIAGITGADADHYIDGDILMGGAGSDLLKGNGGFDIIDGDAWLNVRIRINVDGQEYTADSLNSDRHVAGEQAGKVYFVGGAFDGMVAFGGKSLTSLLVDRTINPGEMEIVREIRTDPTAGNSIDTAVYRGTLAEYEIEGLQTSGPDNSGTILRRPWDVNGDGFIAVRDRDDGETGATITGPDGEPVTLTSRGIVTDNVDLIRNIEQLQFSDVRLTIAGENAPATGTLTINDPSDFGGLVTPTVGQVLSVSLADLIDADGIALDANGLPAGMTVEWQAALLNSGGGWTTVGTGPTYTVPSAHVGENIRAVVRFEDLAGASEQLTSQPSEAVTAPFFVDENSPTGTVVSLTIPFDPDADARSFVGGPVPDIDPATLFHEIDPLSDADGRFTIVLNGTDANGNPRYSLVVNQGGAANLNYEDVQTPVDNEYQIVINSYADQPATPENLVAVRQFTVRLNDVGEAPTDIEWVGVFPSDVSIPLANSVVGNAIGIGDESYHHSLLPSSTAGFVIASDGTVTRTGSSLAQNGVYQLDVVAAGGGEQLSERFVIRTGAFTTNDDIVGGLGSDIIYSLTGNDTLGGDAGDDTLYGQSGNDILNGGAGDDTLIGGAGTDSVNGGTGDDLIIYRHIDGVDTINGGADFDTLAIMGAGGTQTISVTYDGIRLTGVGGGSIANVEQVTLDLFAGSDMLSIVSNAAVIVDLSAGTASGFASIAGVENIQTGNGADQVTLDGAASTVMTGLGDDTVVATVDNQQDRLRGQGGFDTLDYSAYATGLGIALTNSVVTGSGTTTATSDTIAEFEHVIGGSGNDTIAGTGLGNRLDGGSGGDTLRGLNGDDHLIGGLGDDTLEGGMGTDTIEGGAGNDVIRWFIGDGADSVDGGADTDRVDILGSNLAQTVNVVFDGTRITHVAGGSYADVESFTLDMGTGMDTLTYTTSADLTIDLGAGAATGFASVAGVEHVRTGSGDDIIRTHAGASNVFAGDGEDAVIVAVDNVVEQFQGEGGTDTIDYSAYTAALRIMLPGGVVMGSGSTAATSDVIGGFENAIGGQGADVLTGDGGANVLDGGGGSDRILAGGGDDTVRQSAGQAGRDFVDGGAGTDTYVLTGDASAEAFVIYARAAAITAGFVPVNASVEIVIVRNGNVIAELDNIEEIVVDTVEVSANDGNGVPNGGTSGGDTISVAGDFAAPFTSLDYSTITVNGGAGTDVVDISALASDHRIVFNNVEGGDSLVGPVRAQDELFGADGAAIDMRAFQAADALQEPVSAGFTERGFATDLSLPMPALV
ncbi:peroxidase family protein [Sphingomonas baiyangensis]|uniref:Heme peroxidase n=1 Tax=Sphingomonas baiyangensis TaxID=2572576 RepID=A0A4U1L1N9_9SPHN|nr:peroxidase family protein [Sphingomonas baiyangensis]TKD50761.1 hypothetical protein FBR43_08255 [Sphingomonas baiyangensis]